MAVKKELVLIPSAYNHKAMGDIENFIPFYKDDFDVFVITNEKYPSGGIAKDGVHYVNEEAEKTRALLTTADYIIDAGTVSGENRFSSSQKRISVWHGIPYKKMFLDLGKQHIPTAIDYAEGYDLMVSPSEWYTEHFLRDSMLYRGEVLETSVSRTDSLFISNEEKEHIRKSLGIPEGNRILLYAPTFREAGEISLPFDAKKMSAVLGTGWSIVVKLHYLNELKRNRDVIDATSYPLVNNLLAVSDVLITDYSSLLFDYSILHKPAVLYQYDRNEYEEKRSFMFKMEDYVAQEDIVFDEESLYERLRSMDYSQGNLELLKKTFYPHQKENSTEELVKQLALDSTPRKMKEVIFLVNELNQIGGVHTFVMNLAREFKEKYDAKIIVIGAKEFDINKDKIYLFDEENYIDVKLCLERNRGTVKRVLSSTDGYIISCQYGAHKSMQNYLAGKKAVLMFHGDAQDVVDRHIYRGHLDGYNNGDVKNFERLIFLTKGNCDVIKDHLTEEIRRKTIYMENGMDFSDGGNLYRENGEFALVSRLDSDKNPMEAIDIFANPGLVPGRKLHVYGDGSLRPEMERRIKDENLSDRIIFHGYVADKEEIYRGKQGLISISLTEGLPLTVLEAVKYGIPVYAYDSFTSCKDLVTDSTGIRVKTGDKKAFVSALNKTYNYEYFDGNAITSAFSNENVTEKWNELFHELDEEVEGPKTTTVRYGAKKEKTLKQRIRESELYEGSEVLPEIAMKINKLRGRNKVQGMNKPLVSIIMPFYNNNKTVRRAVRSVAKNGYSNYEVLLVNDGSSEDPRPIVKKYKGIRYYYKDNGGLSDTRNYAMEKAKGKYVIFLDSDDVLFPGALSRLVSYAEKHKLKMVSGLTIRRYVNKRETEQWYRKIYRRNYVNRRGDRFRLLNDTIATGKLYDLGMLKENHIRFQDGLYEDILFTGQLYSILDEIGIVKKTVQKWMVYGSGTSITTNHSIDNVRARLKNVDTIFDLQSTVMKVFYTEQYIKHHTIACLYGFNLFSDQERKELFELLRHGINERKAFIVDRDIVFPSTKEVYKSLLNNNYEKFAMLAEGFSARYLAFHTDASDE